MGKLDLYQQNQNLSRRLIESLILYFDDIINPNMSCEQKEQSKQAALTLLDCSIAFMNDSLASEIQVILIRIFSRAARDVAFGDRDSIRKDIKALEEILKVV